MSLLVFAPTAVAESTVSPLEAHEIEATAPRLGGEVSLAPSEVPDVVLSLPASAAAAPSIRLAEREQKADATPPTESLDPQTPLVPLTAAELETRDRVRQALAAYEPWQLNSRDHSPWEIMHAIIARGTQAQIREGGPTGRSVTAVGWLCFNRPAGGRRMMYLSREGLGTLQGPGLEGHRGQLLAILAQARVPADYPIQIDGRTFTVADLIEHEKKTCYPGSELTFKLIGLNHYLDQDARWESDQGQQWDIPRLIREEIVQPIRGATCGGTHRLAGLSLAVKKRFYCGQPLDGEYARAAQYIRDYHAYTYKLQNRDGSLSTDWFRGRGADPDPLRRLRTTGHILEWLCYSLPDSEVRDPRLRAAADYLARLMLTHRNRTWDAGPLGHALHALILYDERVFRPHDEAPPGEAAQILSAVPREKREVTAAR